MAARRKKKTNPNVAQRKASDPKASVWVTASAGTGKTKVLTDRVLRLMLDGSTPENILCVTFTNAAASVMKNRIRKELSEWATCSDQVLDTKLKNLTGRKPSADTKKRARQLFAEFLDTPGGMKIQTIHSFSQSLLRRFPIESGIPPYFDVMDDQTSAEFLRAAQAEILNTIEDDPNSPLAKAVQMITPEVSEEDFVSLISGITYRRSQLKDTFSENGGLEGTIDAIYDYMGVKRGVIKSTQSMYEMFSGENAPVRDDLKPDLSALRDAAAILMEGSDTDRQRAEDILEWIDSAPEERAEWFHDYARVFLTEKDEPRKRLATKACEAALPALEAEAERLLRATEFIKTVNVARGTESLLVLANAVLENYEERKKALNMLDYDDLIHHARLLMEDDNAASWVLRKLDGDLQHILVDEAQDTNPEQWQVIAAITKEFFNGKDAPKAEGKTMFVVGDEKQSIFSFQRADPKEFNRRREYFSEQVKKAGGEWRHVEMEMTFRSTPAIMEAVDAVFANDKASDGLHFEDGASIKHEPFRAGQSGIVELHPVIQSESKRPLKSWSLPLEMEATENPAADLASRIADEIKDWLDSGEELKARGRPINPADIMILVRRRSEFVDHMVRELKKRDVPVAGADRMSLREQIAVMDLVALGEFLLLPSDDYKLASVLKSPLIGMNDKQLEDLAVGREGTLWEELDARKDSKKKGDAIYRKAHEYLSLLQEKLGEENPYEFYSEVLMHACPASDKSGLFAMYSRLGFEAEDPIVEFMNSVEKYEHLHTPSLQGFLNWLEAGQAEVKREMSMDRANPKIHIMTVHGAKGLEAPVVILPDTTAIPSDNTHTRPKFLWPEGDRKVPLWVPRAGLENAKYAEERSKAELERDREFRRLMYVAMTRAEDRLYVYGYQNRKNRPESSWYDLIKTGMKENLGTRVKISENEDGEEIVRFTSPQRARPKPDGVKPLQKKRRAGVPQWARQMPKKQETPLQKFRPSYEGGGGAKDWPAPSPLKAAQESYHLRLGTVVHQLLEFLPTVPDNEREEAARTYLSKPAWKLSPAEQKQTLENVQRIVSDPDFGELFGPNSRPEVSITGYVEVNGQKELLSGQIDRLVVEDDTVLIVDYKNGLRVPEDESDIPEKYLAQLGSYRQALQQIYPDKEVKCALLWTRAAKLQPVSTRALDDACARIGLTPAKPDKANDNDTTKKKTPKSGGGPKPAA